MAASLPPVPLGVVIVTYNSADVIAECLESLLAADPGATLHIAVVDNASTDGTLAHIRDWAAGAVKPAMDVTPPFAMRDVPKPVALRTQDTPGPGITIIETGVNGGFAFGVNVGLKHLAGTPEIDRFWVLNPDCVVPPQTPDILARCATPPEGFSLIGGRIRYLARPEQVESDGAYVKLMTGVTGNFNLGQDAETTPSPDVSEMDFICGASMVASREFYQTVGPLSEDYFLYYEEVDWALRRGNLPLVFCPEALVYHHAGTAIGSPTTSKSASPFSIYFLYRSRMIFTRKHSLRTLPFVYLYAAAKTVQLTLKRQFEEAGALFCAINGLKPPKGTRARLSPDAFKRIFG